MFNRSYNHKDVLTRASITIQILEDVALYKAQLFSSNGNIFSSSDESSELYVRVYKGLDDITSKFTDIVWKRFTSSSNNVEEDLTWGDKYAGKTDITITKDDIKQKANIQVEIYSLINGERTLVAADFITFISINDMQGSDLPPENPKHGDLWLDTSVTPPRLMMWDSNLGMWVEVAIAGRDRRNLIRHSNFYRKNFDYWNNVNNSILEIESMSGKKWAHIKSNIAQNDYCGISQTVSANAKGQYSFQMLSEIYIQSAYPNGDALVAFYSINSLDTKTLIKEEIFDLKTDEKVFTSTFTTLEDTKQIEVIISGQKNTNFDFVVTNIKLENYPIPTEWELAIEDMQDALDQKVGNTPEEVFDSLTDGGKMQGIYVDIDEHGQKNYYVSGRYIDAYNLVVRRKKDNIETLKVDEEGNVSLRVNNLQIISDTGECVNTATENDIDTIDNKVQTVKDSVAQINLDMNGITQRVEATETTTTNLNNKIDNIQVGGRNLLRNTNFTSNNDFWGNTGNATLTIVDDSTFGKVGKIVCSQSSTGITNRTTVTLDNQKEYTMSCYIKSNVNTRVGLALNDSGLTSAKYFNITSTWTKIETTFVNNNVNVVPRIYLAENKAVEVYVANVKFEKGNKATDWTPAPEDVDSAIDAVDSKATTISNKVSEITTNLDSITQRVSSTETTTINLNNKIDNIQVGGRNLILNSGNFSNNKPHGWTIVSSNLMEAIIENNCLKITEKSPENAGGHIYTPTTITDFQGEYIVTMKAKVSSGTLSIAPFLHNPSSGGVGQFSSMTLNTNFNIVSCTVKYPSLVTNIQSLRFSTTNMTAGQSIYIEWIKLEKGNKSTDWSPAPEDTKNEINANIGLGKWRREVYDVGLANASTYPTFENIVGLNPIYSDEFIDNITMLTGISASDTYIVSFKTNAYVSTSKTVTLTPSAAVDDTLTAYVNGIEIGRVNNTENINLPLKQGWNSITLLFYEHTGGEVLNFRTKLSDLVDKIAYGVNSNSVDTSITTVSSRVSQIKTDLNGITSTVTNLQTISTDIARAMSGGKMLYTDPLFKNGNNGINLYNNANNGVTRVERITKVLDCPTNSTHCLKITTTGAANPGFGGFYFGTGTKANKVFITKILAKIPTGRTIYFASNAYGTGGQQKWLTPTVGTGKWEEYLCQVRCGDSGSFSSTNFFYLSGGSTPTASGPLEWYVGYATVIDITDSEEIEARLKTAESKITDEAITNTVKQNFYTKGDVDSKGYQTESQVQQTVDKLQMKFSESGGYNLIRNSIFKNGTTLWGPWTNGDQLSTYTWNNQNFGKVLKKVAGGILAAKNTGNNINIVNGRYYALSYITGIGNATNVETIMNSSYDHILSSAGNVALHSQPEYKKIIEPLTNGYYKVIITFKSNVARNNAGLLIGFSTTQSLNLNSTFIAFTEVVLTEGPVALPWSPHPSEIYDGITTIDKDGITVTSSNVKSKTSMSASGFKITKTDTNEDVFKVNADGTLVIKGSITVTGGSVPTSNLTGTITANMISANAITTDKIATNAITADKINAGTITADKLKIQARDSFSVNPNFSLWSSTYPYGMSSWSSSTCTKVAVDNRNVLQYAVTNASTQMGAVLNTSYFNAGLNLDGMQYIGLEVKYRLTSGTNPAGACMLLDIYYTDNTSERLNLSLKSINSSVTTNTWYTAKKVFKVSNITKTFKSVSGYLLANWSSETNTVKTIQFASANAYACTEQDYLTQTWSSGTEINGAKIKTGTLSADKITTGTLDASKVNVTKLNASNITSGTIDASKITVTNLNANNITAGTIGGGYNLLKNGNAQGGLKYWVSNGGGISVVDSSKGSAFRTTLPSGIRHDDVQLKPNTDYVYSAYLHCSTAITGSSTTPLHFWCNATKGSAGISACSIIKYSQKVPANTWTKVYVHIRTGNQDCWFRPFIYTGSGTGDITVRELGLYESSLNLPYSPHPSEIYDGITTIDKDGITVTSSNIKSKASMTANGFKITKTDTNTDVFKVASDGNLEIQGSIITNSSSGARAELKEDSLRFYNTSDDLAGKISYLYDPYVPKGNSKEILWVRSASGYALKLESQGANASLEANKVYISAKANDGVIGLNATRVNVGGDFHCGGTIYGEHDLIRLQYNAIHFATVNEHKFGYSLKLNNSMIATSEDEGNSIHFLCFGSNSMLAAQVYGGGFYARGPISRSLRTINNTTALEEMQSTEVIISDNKRLVIPKRYSRSSADHSTIGLTKTVDYKTGKENVNIDYNTVISTLWQAVLELSEKSNSLEQELKDLKLKNNTIEKLNVNLNNKLDNLESKLNELIK